MADEITTSEIDDCARCLRTLDAWSNAGSEGALERAELGINRFLHRHGLGGLADVVQHLRDNKGVRLRYLERAMDVDKFVVTGSASFANAKLKDIFSGRIKDIEFESAKLEIRIKF